jgi:hypothetical protein
LLIPLSCPASAPVLPKFVVRKVEQEVRKIWTV